MNIKAKSLGQRWSRGQCNIVDHRKLVSVINNDKNKQRWVCSWTLWSRTATSRSGVFLQGSRALQGPSRHERSPLGCQNPFQYTEALLGKKLRPGTFVPLFMFSSVLLGVHRWTERALYQGCDCTLTITSSSVPICWTSRAEEMYRLTEHSLVNIRP